MSHTPEAHADDMEDSAAMMFGALRELASESKSSLDPRALFLAMSRTLRVVRNTALELERQDWVDTEADPQGQERWKIVTDWLDAADSFFEEVANGWI